MNHLIESDNQTFHQVLDETLTTLDEEQVEYALMGGIASTALIKHRFTHDIDLFVKFKIDLFVKFKDADKILELLKQKGFTTEKTDPQWLYKGYKSQVMVDVIFQSSGAIHLHDDMLKRSRIVEYQGRAVRILSPEDLFVLKALVFNDHTLCLDKKSVRHLIDLLGVIRSCSEFNWEYLLSRTQLGPRRIMGLLLYAQSIDLLVPNWVIRTLAKQLEIC